MAFTISMPVEAPYLELASDVAGKYVELAGGSAADASALAASVASEVGRLSTDSNGHAVVEMAFALEAEAIGVTLTCDGRSVTVRQPVPARNT